MSRLRERRRNRSYTGVLRGSRSRTSEERTNKQIVERGSSFSWRLVSAFIVLVLSGVLTLFFTSDVFYVRSVAVGGVRYMSKEEIFTLADIANMHIFWVTPDAVRQSLVNFPSIADAQVRISWPPNMVNIVVEEREPALVWLQNGTVLWIDINGRVMSQREQRSDLVRVSAEGLLDSGPLGEDGRLNVDVVYGALQLQELRPDVELWRYDTMRGLGFRNANGWDVWLGTGTNMTEKLRIYESIANNMQSRGIQPGEINVVDPDAPFYTVIFGR